MRESEEENLDIIDGYIELTEKLKAELDKLKVENKKLKEISIEAVRNEPVCPDDMPDELWKIISKDRDACSETIRIAVRQAKENIIERFNKALKEKPNDRKP